MTDERRDWLERVRAAAERAAAAIRESDDPRLRGMIVDLESLRDRLTNELGEEDSRAGP